MAEIIRTPDERQPTPLVDRVQRELARRRALAEALRPPKRRAPMTTSSTAKRPMR